VAGRVQGVGFRPYLLRRARALGVTGGVANARGGVRIDAEGPADAVERFVAAVAEAPAPARVERVHRQEVQTTGSTGFEIRPSVDTGQAHVLPAPDLATCPRCLQELRDPSDRRGGYGLLSCVQCGPRYSITAAVPVDRPRTSLAAFPPCSACQAEYDDPDDRRLHAQTIACATCGPRSRTTADDDGERVGAEAIAAAARTLRAGGVLALQGLGGMQLLCDATDPEAVAQLRRCKGRPEQPLAVIAPLVGPSPSPSARAALEDAAAPIVLVQGLPGLCAGLADNVTDGLPWTGLMRPTTGVHHQLLDAVGRPLVCTSGNRTGEPLARGPDELDAQLQQAGAPRPDRVLFHDRPILRRVDDSVLRLVPCPSGTQRVLMRRARGFVPSPVGLQAPGPTVLALGAYLKSTVAVARGRRAVLSPHIGTLGSARALARLEEELTGLLDLTGARPEALACDLHPDLPSTRLAERLADARSLPLFRVQHHEAHLAAVIAEHGLSPPVLGFVFDGAGLGRDGTTWGAEVLHWDEQGITRRPFVAGFALPGGDACARSPARCALGWLHRAPWLDGIAPRLGADLPAGGLAVLRRGLDAGLFPHATSMGRLFDAVAWICGARGTTTYEAQAAMYLEALASTTGPPDEPSEPSWATTLDERLLADAAAVVHGDMAPGRLAWRFHQALADEVGRQARAAGIEDIVLTGGCFQNALLLRLCMERLVAAGRRVHLAEQVPPNDGGLCLGQLWLARQALATDPTMGDTA